MVSHNEFREKVREIASRTAPHSSVRAEAVEDLLENLGLGAEDWDDQVRNARSIGLITGRYPDTESFVSNIEAYVLGYEEDDEGEE